MRIIYKLSTLFIVFFSLNAIADPSQTIIGSVDFKDKEISESLFIIGDVDIHSCKFSSHISMIGDIDIKNTLLTEATLQGNINLKNVEMASGDFSGDIKLNNLTISKNLKAQGDINLKNMTINQLEAYGALHIKEADIENITVTSDNVTLDNVSVKNILYYSNGDSSKKQVLKLKGRSEITGKVTFVSKNGVIKIGSKSLIHESEGAEIIQAKRTLF